MPEITIIVGVLGISQIGLLTAIFFRLGNFEARVEELFRRVIKLEEGSSHVRLVKTAGL